MRYAIVSAAFIVGASAHGLPVACMGSNGVMMPGLSVTDGTPRDCSTNGCGSQADTTILRDREMVQNPLGRTQGNGPVNAENAISNFMGGSKSTQSNKNNKGVGQEDDLDKAGIKQIKEKRLAQRTIFMRGLLDNLLGGLGGGGGGGAKAQGQKSNFASETSVADTAGSGAQSGLPTTDDKGNFNVVYRQINQDGAGPLEMECDGTSCGTQNDAFQKADIGTNVPGAVLGLSLATNTEFGMNVSLPQGMVCKASCGGAQGVCICRMRNKTPAGPFGGSCAVTQSQNAIKRAVVYRLKKRYQVKRVDNSNVVDSQDDSENEIDTRSLHKRTVAATADDRSAEALAEADREEEEDDKQLAAQGLSKRSQATADNRSAEDLAQADREEEQEDEQSAAQGLSKRSQATADNRSAEDLAEADREEEQEDEQSAAQGVSKRSQATADNRSAEDLAEADRQEEQDDEALEKEKAS
ncbi:hypothetical protein CP533_1265 [Ophiocordyceps camponoti-saundersi (nom. inval.)]|nr:hypothetical protein CP533_1265 [Ophiocordyceps camponoti-saundersi (nom. inval.)]